MGRPSNSSGSSLRASCFYGSGSHTLANAGLTKRRVVARRLDATGYATTALSPRCSPDRAAGHDFPDNCPRLVLLVTDLADSRYRKFPEIPKPTGAVRLIVLHVPATRTDAKRTMGKALLGADQYRNRSAQLRRAAPGLLSSHTSPMLWRAPSREQAHSPVSRQSDRPTLHDP